MNRRIIHILGILLIFSSSLTAKELSFYMAREDLRIFETAPIESSYFMIDNANQHPGLRGYENAFYPPLTNSSLFLNLPKTEKANITVHLGDKTTRIVLPVSENNQILTLFIPRDMTLRSIDLPLGQKLSFIPPPLLKKEAELTVFLDRPHEYRLSLPGTNPDDKELKISLDSRSLLKMKDMEGFSYILDPYKGHRHYHFPLSRDKASVLTMTSAAGPEYLSFQAVVTPSFPNPISRTGIQILNRPVSTWRKDDFEIYSWSSFPEILILDCLDYEVQNRFFRRLAFFVEKKGFKGQLLSNAELQGRHAWNAHDYRPRDLAEFYNLVQERNFEIYPEEALLRNILITQGVLLQDEDGSFAPGSGAVLSISRESSQSLRSRFFVHESAHGIYFTSPEYREFVKTIWDSLDEEDRGMWRFFLGWYGYDPNVEDLMINEFQAYLLQQQSDQAPGYFAPRMSSLAAKYPVQKELLAGGIAENSVKFELWAKILEDWLYAKWGLKAGDFFPLHHDVQ